MSTGDTGWVPQDYKDTQVGTCVLESPLSINSIGAVFLARQEHPRRRVAVKVIHRQLARDDEVWQLFLTRFQREADATATLDHANIVPIYEFGETGELAYLVMPYLPDGSLASQLEHHGPMTLPQTVQYIEQVASALDYAHARGIIHRDVKPSNMLLHPDGRVLLSDFGIAHPIHMPNLVSTWFPTPANGEKQGNGSLTETGVVMGTPEYMAPEQVRGDELTPAVDQYGLGISTYELLGGRTPFVADNVPTIMLHQVTEPPPSLRTVRWLIPAAVDDVVLWALAKDPSERPRSAGLFAQALRAAVGSGSANEPEFAPGEADAMNESAITLIQGSGDSNPPFPVPPGIDEGYVSRYAPGGPHWPLPRRQPATRRKALAAGVGLLTVIAALILVATFLVNSMQSALTDSGVASRGVISASASPSPYSPQITASPASTGIRSAPTATSSAPAPTVSPSVTAGPPTNWLTVSPTQVTFACGSTQTYTLLLTNAGPNALSWAVQNNSKKSGLTIQPASGSLAGGGSQSILLSLIVTSPKASQGTLLFTATSGPPQGNPASVAYTIDSCSGGGNGQVAASA